MPIPLKLQVFEGPMDLLLHLIEKNKIDIYDIPIVTITDQYLAYMRQMEHDDMNVTSEFLVMAATLLDIKCRMLLPKEETEEGEEEEDPREELVKRLLEYKMYKYLSEELKEKSLNAGPRYFKQQDLPEEVRSYVPPLNYEELIGDKTAQSLRKVFAEVLKRKKSRVDPIRSGFGKIQKEEINVADKELYICAYLERHPHADFREMLELQDSKEEIIVTFLVILELMKSQKIRITQEEAFGKILIDLVEGEPAEPEVLTEQEPAEVESELIPELEPVEPEVLTEQESLSEPAELELMPEQEPLSEPELLPEQVPADPESELMPELEPVEPELLPEQVPADPESELMPEQDPASEPEAAMEPAHIPEPEIPESVEEEQDLSEGEPEKLLKRHLIARPRIGAASLSRHAMPIKAKRIGKDRYLLARGNRIWSRRKNRERRIKGFKKKNRL